MAAVNAVKKLLIPALLMLLIRGPLAWAGDNFFHDVIAHAPLLTSPALPRDGIGVARAAAIYRLPAGGRGVGAVTRPLRAAPTATIPWLAPWAGVPLPDVT